VREGLFVGRDLDGDRDGLEEPVGEAATEGEAELAVPPPHPMSIQYWLQAGIASIIFVMTVQLEAMNPPRGENHGTFVSKFSKEVVRHPRTDN
jgi:hypothetical protein